MSKKARKFRADTRRDDRWVEGRAKPEDRRISIFGWNRTADRKLTKWFKHRRELLFTSDDAYEWWLHTSYNRVLIHKGGKPR